MRNRVQCLKCHAVLESLYIIHFVQCKCINATFVDGGPNYSRYGGKDLNLIRKLKDEDDVRKK